MAVQERSREKRDRLVNAAAKLFWIKGFDATSLADIAAAADVPLGNVYYYFKTKALLAGAVADLFVADMEEELAAIDAAHEKPAARRSALLSLLARGNGQRVKHGCPIAGAIREFARVEPAAAGRACETFKLLEDWLARSLSGNPKVAGSAIRRASAAMEIWQGAIILAHGSGDERTLRQAFARIAGELDCDPPSF